MIPFSVLDVERLIEGSAAAQLRDSLSARG
jgi:hypothetical protein